jgi:hypothetical protein
MAVSAMMRLVLLLAVVLFVTAAIYGEQGPVHPIATGALPRK